MSKQPVHEHFYELQATAFEQRPNCAYCHLTGEILGQIYLPNFLQYPVGKVTTEKSLCNKFKLRKCRQCGLLYKDPAISREAQVQIYKQSNNLYNYTSSNKYILRRLKIIREMVREENPHLLDIGCHRGDFLKLVRSVGFRTSGIDYSDSAYANHKTFIDMNFYKDFIEDVRFPTSAFDVITAWDVFEHFYDVKIALKKVHNALKPGGYLFLETGNASSFPAKLARLRSVNYWGYASGLTHLNFFDISSIKYVLDNMGFGVVAVKKVYHKGIGNLNMIQFLRQLLTGSLFYISPKAYRYIANLMDKSDGGISFPWKDHIFVIARKPHKQ